MIINEVKIFLESCPFLKKGKININCLGGKPGSYSIEQVEHEPLIKKYCDGGSLRQFQFIFAMRSAYDENPASNIEVSRLFENVATWIEVQNKNKNLPKINDAIISAEKIEVVSKGHLYDSSIDSMRFQMEIRLVYRQQDYQLGVICDDFEEGDQVII